MPVRASLIAFDEAMHMPSLTPKTWNELNDVLWENSADGDRYRPYVAFRGLPIYDEKDPLRTGLQRIRNRSRKRGQLTPPADLNRLERRLIDTFRQYAREHYPHRDLESDWDVLALGRHYLLPTRFLDWTSSPHVALFFVIEDESKWDEDGVIWWACRNKTRDLLPKDLKKALETRQTYFFTIQHFK